jgi:hypothetical protein
MMTPCWWSTVSASSGFVVAAVLLFTLFRPRRLAHSQRSTASIRTFRAMISISLGMATWFGVTAIVICTEGSDCGWDLNCSPAARTSYVVFTAAALAAFVISLLFDARKRRAEAA